MNIESLEKTEKELTQNSAVDMPFKADDETPFPMDALPQRVQSIACQLQWAYKAPADLVGCFLMGCVSACMGKGIRMQTNHPDPTYGLLYQMICTMPGVNKSTLLKWLLNPMVEYQKNTRNKQRIDVEVRLAADSKGEKIPTKKEIDSEIGKATTTLMVEHSSQEGLATSLSYNDEYLAVISSDCSGVVDALKGSKNSGNFQGEILLKGFSGDPYDTNFKVAMDEHLQEVRLSVTWAGTDQTLRDFVTDKRVRSRGLLSRFLFAFIDEPVPRRDMECRRVDRDTIESWHDMINKLLDAYWRQTQCKEVYTTPEARRLVIEFDNERIDLADQLMHLGGLPERWAENALRIALVLHCMEYLDCSESHELGEATMENAILITRWFIGREIAFLEAFSEYDQAIESSKANVFEYLQSNRPSTGRDLERRRLIKKENRYLLKKWVEEGELIVWDASNGSRPSPAYALYGDNRVPESSSQG